MAINWTNRLREATQWARSAHESINQRRKYTNDPYFVHPLEVMEIVASVDHTEDMLIASVNHDVLEDVTPLNPTLYNADILEDKFGFDATKLVIELTDMFTKEEYPDLNRATRKNMERNRIETISKEAKTIKLADLISNTASIVQHDPGFAKTYLKEKFNLLGALSEGSPILLQRATTQCLEAMKQLNIPIPMVVGGA